MSEQNQGSIFDQSQEIKKQKQQDRKQKETHNPIVIQYNHMKGKPQDSKLPDQTVKQPHSFYVFLSSKIPSRKNVDSYKNYQPDVQNLLHFAQKKKNSNLSQIESKQISNKLFFKKTYEYKDLKKAVYYSCLKHNQKLKKKQNVFQIHQKKSKENAPIFQKQFNVAQYQNALGYCLVLSYYTGAYSERISRQLTVATSYCNQVNELKQKIQHQSKIFENQISSQLISITQWLLRALNHFPYYWGNVTRCVELKDHEMDLYQPGNIVTWTQFSSSSAGKPTSFFAQKNTRFYIYSLTGRNISSYSNYKSQTQVLFSPFSHFVVINSRRTNEKGKNLFFQVWLREIFLGEANQNILWVDDNILDSNWQNKKYMEKCKKQLPTLSIIPKVSTEAAMSFLQSIFGKQKKKAKNFKIVSDMNRYNQSQSNIAGFKLYKNIRKQDFENQFLIFTSSQQKAHQIFKKNGIIKKDYVITSQVQVALNFITFKN